MHRSWKQVIGLSVVMGCCVVGGVARRIQADEGTAQDRTALRLQKLQQTLSLSDAQQAQVQQILQDEQTRRQGLTDPTQLQALRQEEDGKIRALLAPEQQAKFDQRQQQRTTHHWGRENGDQQTWQGGGHHHHHHWGDAGSGS